MSDLDRTERTDREMDELYDQARHEDHGARHGEVIAGMPAARYHADPAPQPSLSASIAHVLLSRSPLHAYHQHPRLGGRTLEEQRHLEEGSAAHALLFGEAERVVVVGADDWRTKAAKAARDDARAAGKIPLLEADHARLTEMVVSAANAWTACPDLAGYSIEDGRTELTLIWEEAVEVESGKRSIWCRSRLDWLSNDRRVICDMKTTGKSAEPSRYRPWDLGADIQSAFYRRANARTGGPQDATFVFLVVETEEPFACSFVSLSPQAMVLAETRVAHALRVWARCMQTGSWPGYPNRIAYLDEPAWVTAQWAERIGMTGLAEAVTPW